MDDFVHDRRTGPERISQVTVQQKRAEPAKVLNVYWLIETKCRFQLSARQSGRTPVVLRQHQINDASRYEPNSEEDNQAGKEECGNKSENATRDISPYHSRTSASLERKTPELQMVVHAPVSLQTSKSATNGRVR